MGVTLPYTITNGTPHDGEQVQSNFVALRGGHNDHVHDGTDTPKVNFTNIDGKPANYPPSTHKTTHATGGTDAIAPADIDAVSKAGDTMTGDLRLPALGIGRGNEIWTRSTTNSLTINYRGPDESYTTSVDTHIGDGKGATILSVRGSTRDVLINDNIVYHAGNIQPIIQLVAPPGAIMAFARSTPPDGWLECNGQAVSRTTYADLFAAIGTIFGDGDGSTTFNLPDLRSEFIRGWDHGRGVDSERAFGSWQADEFKAHTHEGTKLGPSDAHYGSSYYKYHADGSSQTGSAGGTETRPRNVALMYCIKY